MQPKTLHLTNAYHAQSGGVGAFYRALLQHANAAGREMRLVVPGEQSGVEAAGPHGLIYTVRAARSPWIDARYRIMLPFGRSGREIRQILRREQPDILEVSDKYTLPYLSGMVRKGFVRSVRRPTEIATSHERMDDNVAAHLLSGGAGRWFARFYMRQIYFPMFDHHLANSGYTAEELIPASSGHTTARGIWVTPMGVDSEFFRPDYTLRMPGQEKRLLYTGRLSREKNVSLLPLILRALPEKYVLLVAGGGPLRGELEAFGPRLRLLGHLGSREQLRELYRTCDAFVHPNPREPFGIAPLEAMACGLPLVAPRAGGVLSYAHGDNAWLCEPTPESFAAAVVSVFADDEVRRARLACARSTAEQHDWSRSAARYFSMLDDLHLLGFRTAQPPLGAGRRAWDLARA